MGLRILVYGINFSPELTGIGKYTGEMCAWLAQRGHEVRVVTAPPYYPQWHVHTGYSPSAYRCEYPAERLRVIRCPLWVPHRPNGRKRIAHLASFMLSSLPVMLAQAAWRPHWVIVIEPTLMCAPAALLAAALARARSWLHVQDFEVDAAFDLGLLPRRLKLPAQYLDRMLMHRFDRLSTISERMLARFQSRGIDSARCMLFRNWVDSHQIYPQHSPSSFRKELGIASDCFVALYSGNMGEKQGLECVIEAAQQLKMQKDILFVMCGEGAARSRLESLANGLGLKNIRWLPLQPIEKLNDLLNLADVHLLPQHAGAADLVMPSKLCGMLASGRPVIATVEPESEIAQVLMHTGLISPPGNVDGLVRMIHKIRANSTECRDMGISARRYAEQNLSGEAILGQFERELLSIGTAA